MQLLLISLSRSNITQKQVQQTLTKLKKVLQTLTQRHSSAGLGIQSPEMQAKINDIVNRIGLLESYAFLQGYDIPGLQGFVPKVPHSMPVQLQELHKELMRKTAQLRKQKEVAMHNLKAARDRNEDLQVQLNTIEEGMAEHREQFVKRFFPAINGRVPV